jgi:hypothetical protein
MTTEKTEYPICPHCGEENKRCGWLEVLANTDHFLNDTCKKCGKEYRVTAQVSEVVFTTRKISE